MQTQVCHPCPVGSSFKKVVRKESSTISVVKQILQNIFASETRNLWHYSHWHILWVKNLHELHWGKSRRRAYLFVSNSNLWNKSHAAFFLWRQVHFSLDGEDPVELMLTFGIISDFKKAYSFHLSYLWVML